MDKLAQLRASERTVQLPFLISTDQGGELSIDEIYRLLPGRRLTARAYFREQPDKPVLLKLFFASTGNERYWQREIAGASLLAGHGIPTPKMLASGHAEGEGRYVLYEHLDAAVALTDAPASAGRAVALTALLHARGLLHKDLHFGNFLQQGDAVFLIDGDAVTAISPGAPLPSEKARDNLALLLAQLPYATGRQVLEEIVQSYRKINPTLGNTREIEQAVGKARQKRLANYLRKTVRTCSEFVVEQTDQRFVVQRRAVQEQLQALVADPDRFIAQGIILKAGNTATVAQVRVGDLDVVIKRYNIKNWRHALSRAFRPSRAWRAWISGQRLGFIGIQTPQPLAMIEERIGPFRQRAWLITEKAEGCNLAEHLATHGGTDTIPSRETQIIASLFDRLHSERLTHGDLKASNLIWTQDAISLIDLDSMRTHRSPSEFRRHWQKDRSRLLRNWQTLPAIQQAIEKLLPAVDQAESSP